MKAMLRKLRVGLCSVGVLLGLLVPSGVVSAAPAAGWTAVAQNARGVNFTGRGPTMMSAENIALRFCRQSRSTANPRSCHIVREFRS